MILWRLSAHKDLQGTGGLNYPGRWHHAGRPIVYLADHPASCMLEALVHLECTNLPETFTLLKVEVPDNVVQALDLSALHEAWVGDQALTQRIGSGWLAAAPSVALQIPSAIVPEGKNTLLNPLHPAAVQCRIVDAMSASWDKRLRPN
ncbi:RES family NAD+ phosphorylase [Paludibacterium sp.]|uniref:RES family NAD+ phosphorylase n=1 Tax=Paludibacterium sp. TaxID=1917523 RepID=UPI0025FBAF21|nr:RES family NAD+ phosphorylase [Paludibacterium sp.]MBV8649577.1 RES family NAD+ phosphorylase [Paludibacterium sp.]